MAGILDMALEGLWEIFEGHSAETCARKIPLGPMGVRGEGPACADPGARPPSALAEFPHLVVLLVGILLAFTPEGIVVGFQNFA